MNARTDQQLLLDYAENRSDPAFAELVRRHVDLVYSAALRRVGDIHHAQDVTQGAFTALAQNARQLTGHPVLSGWLHRTTQNIAANLVRSNNRRQAREQEVVTMNEILSASPDVSWEAIAPHLDAVLDELEVSDRDAVMLRYFEKKSAHEVATQLGISDDAAQKRVSRAVERLREFFAKRGITVGASGLAIVVSANAVQAAPVGLALTISTAAALTGTTLATTATATATKAIAMTAIQKTIVTATIAVLAGAGIYEARQASQLINQVQTLQQQHVPLAAQIKQLELERDNATNQLAAIREDNDRLHRNTAELLKLRGEISRLRSDSEQLARLKAGTGTTNALTDTADAAELALLNKVKQLKQLAERMPEKTIPEFRYLDDHDWLELAGQVNALDTDSKILKVLLSLRLTAKEHFAGILSQALKSYTKANGGQLPDELSRLQIYFPSPVEDSILQRYVLRQAGNVNDLPEGQSLVDEKSPTYPNFDTLIHIDLNGWRVQNVGSREFIKHLDDAVPAR